ncbi:ATP-dependent DNA ligase [Neptunitalea lumnitzerae]|uniref:DNA ligase (ATP) n=1 Tax=Neptunitalea lumnitzerae TaxID=2965509 RepID=A0ABQ5MG50_9FLAO|nr:ATP-dependent DNA ligase [Neptunitalea sp. Y10]GLB48374.1 ATP-dependent DNA ligase [Neptunitalea sp. Y10]
MKAFGELIRILDATNKTNEKVKALATYFKEAPAPDKLWTIALLSHRRPKRPVTTTLLREWASEAAHIPLWLFEESYHIVGDLAETIALVIPEESVTHDKSLADFATDLLALYNKDEQQKKEYLLTTWQQLDYYERFAFNKIITGGFRIGISQKLMTRALAKATEIDEDILAYKLMGDWTPQTTTFNKLILEENEEDYLSKPYPFYLAYALDQEPAELGDVSEWSFEHKWDGIRAQLIVRNKELFVWSRGEELVTDKYPEFEVFTEHFPDGTVIDGELLPYPNNSIGTFNDLQTRIGRKNITKKLLEKTPVIIKAYDVLEWKGEDVREQPFKTRRGYLNQLIQLCKDKNLPLYISEVMHFNTWEAAAKERERSRDVKSEGLMLKRNDSPYLIGRKKGDWWKWKVDPLTIDAVLTYAMRGHGRRTNLFTDYTFALWDNNELVTFAKAYSGLTDAEFRQVDNFVKRNTTDKFGPVRQVTPELVFEIAFEGIAPSKRHKSGVAVRFPRILRWRQDKKIEEANSLDDLKALIIE